MTLKPNEFLQLNADILVDVAEDLLDHSPFEAYLLLEAARSVRPNGPRIRRLLKDIPARPMADSVVAWRHDGLCERLSTLLIGHFTAKSLNIDFRFVWPGSSAIDDLFQLKVAGWHDVPDDPSSVLSGDFCQRYRIDESEVLHPRGRFRFKDSLAKRLTVDSFDKPDQLGGTIRPCWLAANRVFPDMAARYTYTDLRRFFLEHLISKDVREAIGPDDVRSLPGRKIALHIRGGDIIYGGARFLHSFGRLKSVSLPVAEQICETYQRSGDTVLLFGATRDDLDFLADRYPNAVVFSDRFPSDVPGYSQVIREVIAMSDCDVIVSSPDTAVSQLAAMLGPAMFVSTGQVFDRAADYAILRAYAAGEKMKDLHPLQQAFVFWGLFANAPDDTDDETLLTHIRSAQESDPENSRYLVFRHLLEQALGRAGDARTTFDEIRNRFGHSTTPQQWRDVMQKTGIALNGKVVPRLLLKINARQDLPQDMKDAAGSLLSGVQPNVLADARARLTPQHGKGREKREKEIYGKLRDLGCGEFRTVLEIGANIGQDTSELLELAPKARISAFEPDPHAAEVFRLRVSSPRVTLYAKAVAASTGEITFFPSRDIGNRRWNQSGSIRRPHNHLKKHPEVTFAGPIAVPATTLDEWADEQRAGEIDLIWADVQGAEEDLVRGGQATLKKTRYVFTEYSNEELYEGQIRLDELLGLMPGFRVVEDFGGDILLENTLVSSGQS